MSRWEDLRKKLQTQYETPEEDSSGSSRWKNLRLGVTQANDNPYTYYMNQYAFDEQGRLKNGVNSALNAVTNIGKFIQPLAAPQQVLFGGVKAVEDLFTGASGAEAWMDFRRGLKAAGSYATYNYGRDIPGVGKLLDNTFGKLETDDRADSILGYEILSAAKMPDYLARPLGVAADFLVDVPVVGKIAKAAGAEHLGLNFSTHNVLRNADGTVMINNKTGGILTDMAKENIAEAFTVRRSDGTIDGAKSWQAWSTFGRTVLSSPLSSAPIRDIFRAIPQGIRKNWAEDTANFIQDKVPALPEWLISDTGRIYGLPEMDLKKFLREGDFGGVGSSFLQFTKYRLQRLKSEVVTRGMFASKFYSDLTKDLSDVGRKEFDGLVKATLDNANPGQIIENHAKLREFAVRAGIDPVRLYQGIRYIYDTDVYNGLAKNSLGKLSDAAMTRYESGVELLEALSRGEKLTYVDLSRVRRGMHQGTSSTKEAVDFMNGKVGDGRSNVFKESEGEIETVLPDGSKVKTKVVNRPLDYQNLPGGIPKNVLDRFRDLNSKGFSNPVAVDVLTHLYEGQKGWWTMEGVIDGSGTLTPKDLQLVKDLVKADPNLSLSTYNGFLIPGTGKIPQVPVVMNMKIIKQRLRQNADVSPVIEELAKKPKLTATTITKVLNDLKKDPTDQAKMAEYHTLFGLLGGASRPAVDDFVRRFVYKQYGPSAGDFPQQMINGQYTFFDSPNAPWVKPSQQLQSYINMARNGAEEGVPIGAQYSKATIPVKAFNEGRSTDKSVPVVDNWSLEAQTHLMRIYRAFADPETTLSKIDRSAPARVTIDRERLIDAFKRAEVKEEDAVVMVARIMGDRSVVDPRSAPLNIKNRKPDYRYARPAYEDPVLERANPLSLSGGRRIVNERESTSYNDPSVHPADFMVHFLQTQGYNQIQSMKILSEIGSAWHQNGIIYKPAGEELWSKVNEAIQGIRQNEGGGGKLALGTNNSVFEGRQDLPDYWREALDEISDINKMVEEGSKRTAKQLTRRKMVQEIYDHLKGEGVVLRPEEVRDLSYALPGATPKGWKQLDSELVARLKGIEEETGPGTGEWSDMPFKEGDYIPAHFYRFLTQETATRKTSVGNAVWRWMQARWAQNKIASPQGIARDLATNFVLAEQMGVKPHELLEGMRDFLQMHSQAFGSRKAARKGVPETGYDGLLDTTVEMGGVKYSEFLEYGDFTHATMYYKDVIEQMESTLDFLTTPAIRQANWFNQVVGFLAQKSRDMAGTRAGVVTGLIGDATGVGGVLSKKLADTKGYLESLSKTGVYMALRKKGYDPALAARHADEILFNYENQPMMVDFLRRYGVSPFAAFGFMSTGRFIRTLYENPYNISRWYKLPQSLAAGDENQSEVRSTYFAAPDYMRQSLWVAFPDWTQPGKQGRSTDDDGNPIDQSDAAHDTQGRRRFVNLGAILPESGNVGNAMFTSDPLAQWTPPVLSALKAMFYGEGFGGVPVYEGGGTFFETAARDPEEAVRGFLQQAHQYMIVPWEPGSPMFDRMVKSVMNASYSEEEIASNPMLQGILKTTRNGIIAAPFDQSVRNVRTETQEEPADPFDAMLRMSGITVQAISPTLEMAGAAINKLLAYKSQTTSIRDQWRKAQMTTFGNEEAGKQVDLRFEMMLNSKVNEMMAYLAVVDPDVEREMIKFPEYREIIEEMRLEFEQSKQNK
jgi:hypothetical protein